MNIQIYFALLALVSGYAFLRGRREEPVAAVCISASLLSLAVQPLTALIDVAVPGGSWACPCTGGAFGHSGCWTQLTPIVGHALKLLDHELLPVVHGASRAS
jgi:hypothetical protein